MDSDKALREKKKRRLIRLVIVLCLCLVPFLTYLETQVFQLGTVEFPVSGNVLVFMLININIILLLLIVFLALRNLVQLIFERKRLLLGAKLRTKLVISFILLSLIPTGLLFFISLQFVSTSMDYWFNANVEKSLIESLDIAKGVYRTAKEDAAVIVRQTEAVLQSAEVTGAGSLDESLGRIGQHRQIYAIELLSTQRQPVASFYRQPDESGKLPAIPGDMIRRTLNNASDLSFIQPLPKGELVRYLKLIELRNLAQPRELIVVVSQLVPVSLVNSLTTISQGLEGYRQLMLIKTPIKSSLLVMLLLVTLLIVFCAIWFGLYVSASLTGPISKLAEATKRVAEGELNFVIEKESGDEMGTLVDSFNLMIRDLLIGQKKLSDAYHALQLSNQEVDERRRYIEIILENVTAGVISIDQNGCITTINRFAEELLNIDKETVVNRRYQSILRWAHLTILEKYLDELDSSKQSAIQRSLHLTIGGSSFFLRVNFVKLTDEEDMQHGVVLVFDNLTEIEKIQRMAAWREVARRIAHEVKNPLTPIQLSAQRLRKKYLVSHSGEGEIFDKCTNTIIEQVDELKRLVEEFSSFARMPAVEKSPNSLFAMCKDVLVLYEEAHPSIQFSLVGDDGMADVAFDFRQMKRVLINLLDNSIAAMHDSGEIQISLQGLKEQQKVFLEISDTGPGINEEDKSRLFEPYFSTKKSGTGLGLAIASTVVSEHGGNLSVRNNFPKGAKFIVELPFT